MLRKFTHIKFPKASQNHFKNYLCVNSKIRDELTTVQPVHLISLYTTLFNILRLR